MAKPRVFISSTFSDLNETRNKVRDFIIEFGYEAVAFEKNDIPYEPNQFLEESCYEEIKESSMFILLLKSNFGQPTTLKRIGNINIEDAKSITQIEYIVARSLGIPIFVFIYKSSLDEYYTYKDQENMAAFRFNYLDGINHFNFVKELFEDKAIRFINSFTEAHEIEQVLKKQWAGLFNKYLKNFQKYKLKENEKVYINSFKLFYFRRNIGLSQAKLAKRSGLSEREIQSLEDAGIKKKRIDLKDFRQIELINAQKIADSLSCSVGSIRAGLPDDFLTQYLLYYFKNKGTQQRKGESKSKSIFKTKVVVFDFDGTLTKPNTSGLTSWEKIWLKLGYEINDCAVLHRQYSNLEITHKKWCEITEDKFKKKVLSKEKLNQIANGIELIDGTLEVLKELTEKGINLYICSGSIDYIIKNVLGDLTQYFDEIKSNKFRFDIDGNLHRIIGTKYDFEGKSDYLSQIAKENQIEPYEILYIGNSLNDEWAHQSGAITLCVNPRLTNPHHPVQWSNAISKMNNLKEILNFVND